MDDAGCFTAEAGERFQGLAVLDEGNAAVIAALEEAGALLKVGIPFKLFGKEEILSVFLKKVTSAADKPFAGQGEALALLHGKTAAVFRYQAEQCGGRDAAAAHSCVSAIT